MEPAKLGGIPGAAEVRSRRRSESIREYRGTFVATRENDAKLVHFLKSRERIHFEGVVDGQLATLTVIVTDVSPATGMVFFQAAE